MKKSDYSDIRKTIIQSIVLKLLKQSTSLGDFKDTEVAALTKLYMIGSNIISGDENPRECMREISDQFLNYIIKHKKEISIMEKIGSFFVIEWCFRNNYLNEDWKWEWQSSDEGKLHYNPKIPISEITFPYIDQISLSN